MPERDPFRFQEVSNGLTQWSASKDLQNVIRQQREAKYF